MPLLKTPAVVLRSRKWGETDRIVFYYTLCLGKLRGVARGARRIKSRFGSVLEPFVHCDLNLFEKPHDSLYRITQADIREPFTRLREDLGLMAAAGRLVNLVNAMTAEGDPCPRMFETLVAGLRALDGGQDPAWTALLFQVRLLGYSGYRPQMDHCAACGGSIEKAGGDHLDRFSPSAGGLVCGSCAERNSLGLLWMAPGSLALLEQALRMRLGDLSRLKASGQVRAEMETAVEAYVMVVAGKRLPPVNFLVAESRSFPFEGRPYPRHN